MHLDHSECTALCYAARGEAVRATWLLLELGLYDEHALELAREKGNPQIIQLLER
ncbi:MAG TPA: hypothetical protein VK041_03955 [Opitutales bacterium]|nr:hypothetical protein [Opitutales bacterium]